MGEGQAGLKGWGAGKTGRAQSRQEIADQKGQIQK